MPLYLVYILKSGIRSFRLAFPTSGALNSDGDLVSIQSTSSLVLSNPMLV